MSQIKKFMRMCLPRSIRRQRILGGPLKGQWIVTSWHDYPSAIIGRNERPLLDWLTKTVKQGETWLDIGSHYGYVAMAMCKLVGSTGRVYAFEPMLRTAGYVQQTRQLNHLLQLTIVPLALANPTALEVNKLSTTRGMLDSTIDLNEWSETFYISQLDWLWPQICNGNTWIDGIKIDVQGMELETLRGMSHILQTQKPKLIVEVHEGVDRSTLLQIIENAGYSCSPTAIDIAGQNRLANDLLDNHSYAFTPTSVD